MLVERIAAYVIVPVIVLANLFLICSITFQSTHDLNKTVVIGSLVGFAVLATVLGCSLHRLISNVPKNDHK